MMDARPTVAGVDVGALVLVRYPDPRLREVCTPLDGVNDVSLSKLGERTQRRSSRSQTWIW